MSGIDAESRDAALVCNNSFHHHCKGRKEMSTGRMAVLCRGHPGSVHLSRRFLGGDSWRSNWRRADGERERPPLSARFLMVGDTSRLLFTL